MLKLDKDIKTDVALISAESAQRQACRTCHEGFSSNRLKLGNPSPSDRSELKNVLTRSVTSFIGLLPIIEAARLWFSSLDSSETHRHCC